MRLFYALWPSPEQQRDWFNRTGALLHPWGGRRLPAESLHLTLHFLGEVSADRVGQFAALGKDVAGHPVDLRFDRIEAWGKADLACLRADEVPTLTRLVGQLGTGLELAGFPLDKRRFKAHITLARKLDHHTGSLPLWPVLEWQADTLALVRSRLSPAGPEYAPIATWSLR